MNFAITQLYVVPTGNTLPTAGDNKSVLTPGQFGIYRQDYTAVAVSGGTAAGAEALIVGQGRTVTIPGLGTKGSDFIYKNNITNWIKYPAVQPAVGQVATFSDWSAQCEEDISLTLRLRSQYIDTLYYGGLTRSVTVKTPCCECGADPCTEVDAAALVAQLVAAINAEPTLSIYVTASATGEDNDILTITGKPVLVDPERCDPSAFPFQYDRLYFHGWAYSGPATSQDFNITDCSPVATYTVTSNADYAVGSAKEIQQLEKRYFSYNTTYKDQFIDTNYNGAFDSLVVPGTWYDSYYIEFWESNKNGFNEESRQKAAVYIAVPTTLSAAIESIFTTWHKAFTNATIA